ncbi:hypothetical protein [Endozoicomonas arenosclerae]|uniref:hypothetical protein n=1 Tax=Endozoicomonas arenosclerae TaxID=1633495 RepID=UPI0007841BC3|nr:hypothetical protein [Endozoicomonas arenosclerae]
MILKLLSATELWSAVLAKSHQAIQLKSIALDEEPFRIVRDNNLTFYFKSVRNLTHKPRSETLDESLYKTQDPFLKRWTS